VVRKGDIAMESGQHRSNLTKLSELEVPLEERWQDIRNLDVYDVSDEQIGSVEDLYIDREARQPSYLIVSAGGVLGVGKKHFLIPVEEVSRDVGEERVTVTVPKDKVLNSPEFDPDVGVPALDLQRAIDAYYGHR
jgi:sporulation protein YlmC with PRC-barrel domain